MLLLLLDAAAKLLSSSRHASAGRFLRCNEAGGLLASDALFATPDSTNPSSFLALFPLSDMMIVLLSIQ
jgi:hypothetical protein